MNHRRRPLDDDNYLWSWNCAMFPSIDYKIFETKKKKKKNKKRMNRIDSIAIRFQCKYNPYAQIHATVSISIIFVSPLFHLFLCRFYVHIYWYLHCARFMFFAIDLEKRRMEMRTTSHDIKWETNLLSRQN